MKFTRILTLTLFTASILFATIALADENRIQPYKKDPRFWQYEGKPIILLGGTDDDNLFQWPNAKTHLKKLAAVGGNYIRNTMSDRNNKDFEVYPFKKQNNGKYDLDRWNPVYWDRFETMLKTANQLDIIVQIEVWDRFDYSRDNWEPHPYNPKNNINYTYKQTGFAEHYPKHPGSGEQPFFHSVPGMKKYKDKYQSFHAYQIRQVDKMLSHALKYNNVLYCMNNETDAPPIWGQYWIRHIKKRAKEKGVNVCCTDMFDAWDIKHKSHHVVYKNPAIYDFIDVSQNNHNKGQTHWDNIQWTRNFTSNAIRPINTVKIYGADTGKYGSTRDGQERFWRNIIGGMAATRFHRPDSGLGLSPIAQANIKSMRMLLNEIDMFTCQPDAKQKHFTHRDKNEVYMTHNKNKQYALYFPNGGQVEFDLTKQKGKYKIQWLDIHKTQWLETSTIQAGKNVKLQTPKPKGYWAAILKK
ncbi:hypothetical protein GF373_13460 [bacterium]|nr:hypothetical protein [bacterium]